MGKHKLLPAKTRLAAVFGAVGLAVTSLSVPAAFADGSGPESTNAPAGKALLPKPNSVAFDQGAKGFTFKPDTCVSIPGKGYEDAVKALRDSVKTSYGLELPIADNCPVKILHDQALADGRSPGNEGYKLQVAEDGITLTAASQRGAIWGMQTLKQLIGPWANAPMKIAEDAVAPAVTIADAPRYPWRGLMIDPVRSFIPVDEVKNLIDMMSEVKYNVLHIHLNDDQGWRLEIDNPATPDPDGIDYSLLTKKSGKTSIAGTNFNNTPGRTGFYTKQQFIDLVAYAASRGISILPEIDGPGHATGILHAIPQLNTEKSFPHPEPGNDTPEPFREQWFAKTSLDASSPVTLRFMDHVYRTVEGYIKQGLQQAGRPEYKLNYFHIGGDESRGTPHEDYRHYMAEIVKQFDPVTHPQVWNEAIDPVKGAADLLPEGTLVHQWTGVPPNKGNKISNFVRDKHAKVLMSQAARAYFPQRPSTDVPGPEWACTDTHACTTFQFYNWDPTQLAGVTEADMMGVEGALWQEHLRTEHDAQFQLFPRAFATAEVGWTQQAMRNYDDFKARMSPLGVNMINRDATFHLAPELPDWQGQARGVAVQRTAEGGEALVGLVAQPGMKQADLAKLPAKATFVDSAGVSRSVPVRYEMAREFNYAHPTYDRDRVMNSLIKVYATLPKEVADGVGTLSGVQFPAASVGEDQRVAPLDISIAVPVKTEAPPSSGGDTGGETGGQGGDTTNPGGEGGDTGNTGGTTTPTNPDVTNPGGTTPAPGGEGGETTNPGGETGGTTNPGTTPGTGGTKPGGTGTGGVVLDPVLPGTGIGGLLDPGKESGKQPADTQGKESGKTPADTGSQGKQGQESKSQGDDVKGNQDVKQGGSTQTGKSGGTAKSGKQSQQSKAQSQAAAKPATGRANLAATGSDAVTASGILAGLALLGAALALGRRRRTS